MRAFGPVVLAFAALTACASPPPAPRAAEVAAPAAAPVLVATLSPPVSDLDAMRAALPTFALRRGGIGSAGEREVSVVRDINFPLGSALLPQAEVDKLAPLLPFLRANPLIVVRIDGYGDDKKGSERDINLSIDRAQTVARALLTDMRISNTIEATAAPMPQSRYTTAELSFTGFDGTGQ